MLHVCQQLECDCKKHAHKCILQCKMHVFGWASKSNVRWFLKKHTLYTVCKVHVFFKITNHTSNKCMFFARGFSCPKKDARWFG